jgi:hypothetical protein
MCEMLLGERDHGQHTVTMPEAGKQVTEVQNIASAKNKELGLLYVTHT